MKLLVVDVVGLRPKDLAHAPNIRALADRGFAAPLDTVFPAVTCTVQATLLTGKHARDHGIVANGWYFRDLAQIWLWRQSNHLVQSEEAYTSAHKLDPSFTCAKMFWWYNMYAPVSWSVTPRPEYHADGLKKPGLYSEPPALGERLQRDLGPFSLFQFWGPGAGIASSKWIVDASLRVIAEHAPTLALVYVPHLDYDHQRYGPDDPRSRQAVADVDREVGRLIDDARARGAEVMVLSEYGIEEATHPIMVNRVLHERGLLRVQETSHGQLLDAGASRAFAVADHQCAHVYVRDRHDVPAVAGLLRSLDGVARVLDRDEQIELGIDHERSGELVCVAAKGAWFAYHYWLDDDRRPDFATTVDIHRKPGYDPTELFLDPKLRLPKLKIAKTLAKKLLGFRYLMDVIGTDPTIVRGTHGRLFEDHDAGPVFVSSSTTDAADRVAAISVRDRILAAVYGS
ncbi:MAG: alkaline phosphatase family protein [Planctomycetes bacterium]|nr:alkaline phosphatase family protein [Planctomycetota bacterium]